MSEYWISFPNLGITFNLNPVAFTVGSFEVKWSLIFTVIAVAAGIILYFKAISKQNLGKNQVSLATAVTAFFALVGARLTFVIPEDLWLRDQLYQLSGNYPDEGYFNTFYKFIAFFDKNYAGLNFFGGLIFGLIALAIICKIKKWPISKYLDSTVYALPAAVAINSLGYITAQSSFGRHTQSLLGINGNLIQEQVYGLYQSSVLRGEPAIGPNVLWRPGEPVSPTPIYQMLGCIAVILIVYLISKFMIFVGEKFLWSLGLFSLTAAFIENARVDSPLFWNMRINVLFSVIAVLACTVLIAVLRWQIKEGRLRGVSLYVDARKNNGFENDTFVQKVYRGEAADVDSNQASTIAPGEAADVIPDTASNIAPGEAADVIPDTAVKNAPGEADITVDTAAGEATEAAPGENKTPVETPTQNGTPQEPENKFEPSAGSGQVWTADSVDDDSPDDGTSDTQKL